MNNYNERTGRRPYAEGSCLRSRYRQDFAEKKDRNSFMIRFNICLTVIAAVFLLSRLNTEAANKITEKAESIISEQTSFSDIKDKAAEVFMPAVSDKNSGEVFSDSDSDVEQSIIEKTEQDRELEEQLKNK
ncbi:MAG: hypothetical protein LUD77_07655 [Clostridiales bacterium]|nr:hypothetical protein [Clostridiales bacterium]